ncbi:hypothetical protein DFJ43DRAFT_1159869 [Lentinula guzmanii]|uniref:Uncharacterized protein n=1 Tax=Lentinula guzmanii TaxID=2804957 RepID=A0AA38MWM6_9AGAR|nr:hypothetical protein DFJ43DRAFT_1159869 [Lentinula guzmanii]
MVTGNMLRRQRFMHYDASFDRPNRNCRTHANDQLISRLKKLPLQSRLEMNKKIMDRNRARRERACSNSDEVSDVESLITIEDEEMDDIRSDPDVFAAAKPLLDAATIRELNRANKEDATREKEARLTLGDSEWTLEPDAILTKIDATQLNPISFPPEMFFTAKHKHNFPLAFFTPKNLSFINSNLHKNAHEDKKYILNISDMEKKIKGAKTGPSRDEEMTVLDWWKAYTNYHAFESSRSMSPENNPRALFFKSHFNFFVNQEDSEELYDIWRPYEAKLRQRHYELDMEFDAAMYANTWMEIKAISASRPKQYAAKENTYQHVYPSSLSPFTLATGTKTSPLVASDAVREVTRLGTRTQTTVDFPSYRTVELKLEQRTVTRKSVSSTTASDCATKDAHGTSIYARYAEAPTPAGTITYTPELVFFPQSGKRN